MNKNIQIPIQVQSYEKAHGDCCKDISDILYEVGNPLIQGEIIAEDDYTRLILVDEHNLPNNMFIVGAEQVRKELPFSLHENIIDDGSYFCQDIKTGVSLFYCYKNQEWKKALFDSAGNFFGYDDIVDWKMELEDAECPSINIQVSDADINNLEDKELIAESENNFFSRTEEGVDSIKPAACSPNRGLRWFSEYACAILTAWRGDKTRTINDANNKELANKLLSYGFGVTKVRGCYTEEGRLAGKENSFFIVNRLTNPDFFNIIKALSTHYEQDCFLYKDPGALTHAILVATNQYAKFDVINLGELHINKMDAGEYTEFGNARVSFEK